MTLQVIANILPCEIKNQAVLYKVYETHIKFKVDFILELQLNTLCTGIFNVVFKY